MTDILKTFMQNDKNYYYIHRHIDHFEKDDAINSFSYQKNENYQNMKQRYRERYISSLKAINQSAIEKLDLATRKDSVLTNLDKSILDSFNAIFDKNKDNKILFNSMKEAGASLNQFLKSSDLKDLDILFSQISSASKILKTNSKELALILSRNGWINSGRNLSKIRDVIQKEINKYENKTISFQNKEYMKVLKQLDQLVEGLSAPYLTSPSTLRQYLSTIFSSTIGEYLVSKTIVKAYGLPTSIIEKTLTGDNRIKIDNSKELAEINQMYGQQGTTVFKTDNSFKDLDIQLTDSGDSFKFDLGLSTKWYSGFNDKPGSSVAITKEQNFIYRVSQLMSDDNYKYYVYNSLALVNQDGTAYSALKSALVARMADYFISGFGLQGDFSQFLVINGKFYSIWQLILTLEKNNQGQGNSGLGKAGKSDPITLSATGLKKIAIETDLAKKAEQPNIFKAYQRAKKQNEDLELLRLTGRFYPNRLKNIVDSEINTWLSS